MRLASIYWSNIIQYNEFTIYFVRSTTLPEIVDRFSKYDGPIALRFTKEIQMDAITMSKHLQKLTNLTGLSMSENVKSVASSAVKKGFPGKINISYFAENFSLSNLTNLHEWYSMPLFGQKNYENIANFSKLTKLKLRGFHGNKTILERIIANNTDLEVLDADSFSLKSILPNPSRLTSLCLPRDYTINEEYFSKLGNLRHLQTQEGAFFRILTALESLETQSHHVVYFDVNTTLSRLKLTSSSDEILKTSLPNLVNLHELIKQGRVGRSIDIPLYLQPDKLTKLHIMQEEKEKLFHMSRLTNLVNLVIFRPQSETDQETLEPIMNLTKLTQLRLHCDLKSDNSPYIEKLTNLKSLILRGNLTNLMTADVARKFSNLEELRFNEYFVDSFSTHIQVLNEPSCYHTILTNFSNLTRLQLHNKSPDLWETLTKLGNLQSLTIGWMNGKDMTALTKLMALTDLDICQFDMTDREIFAKLTNLQRLWLRYENKKEKEYFYLKLPYLHSFGWKRQY
jgi:hypothetical protein